MIENVALENQLFKNKDRTLRMSAGVLTVVNAQAEW